MLAIQPNDIYTLTEKLSDLGNYTGAISYYDKALAINPHYVRALTDKGTALDDLGKHTGAKLYLEFLAVEDISKADPNKISFDIGSPSMEDLRAQ